jgi:hypothetical protein
MTVTPGTVVCESMTTSVKRMQNEHLLDDITYLEQVYQDYWLLSRDYDLLVSTTIADMLLYGGKIKSTKGV